MLSKSSRGEADSAKKNSLHYPKAGPSSVPERLGAFSNSHQLAVKGRLALRKGLPIQPSRVRMRRFTDQDLRVSESVLF